jgi:hypothetical protein
VRRDPRGSRSPGVILTSDPEDITAYLAVLDPPDVHVHAV